MTTPQMQMNANAAKQNRLAQLWRAGMLLLCIGIVSDTAGQVWNSFGKGGWTLGAHALAAVPALLGGGLGLVLTMFAAVQFQKGPLPRFAVYGTTREMDERDVGRMLQAQAQAQRYFVWAILGLAFVLSGVARHGIFLSWWSCFLGLILLLNAVIYLPISILATHEKDLEDDL